MPVIILPVPFIGMEVVAAASGTKSANDRKLGSLLKRMKKGDILIISEISRLGRNLMGIMSTLHLCMNKQAIIYTVKEKYELGNNINSHILAFAFGLSAQIERDLISQRTKEGLARRKAEGVILGRKNGSKNKKYRLVDKEKVIKEMLQEGQTKTAICRRLKCHIVTLNKHLTRMNAEE
ncbi:recombinase family protein [Bacteroides sp. 224]|uniref:recombinase family protein n=1 Tax=Bacteroides sp. 224 TaxID=2302936 RepID=UPI0013D59C3F|nr:recombinase family protein [Bacteroides sp. 224]NDV64068.1 invertase [Bacteroides sp. 224]